MKAKISKSKKHKKRGVKSKEVVLQEASLNKVFYIESLIETSSFDLVSKTEIESNLNGFLSDGEADELINFLLQNQRCNIDSGCNYGMKDIEKKLSKLR